MMHMHKLIDAQPHPHPHQRAPCANASHGDLRDLIEDSEELDLPDADSNERVFNWILNNEADPQLPVNDLDLDQVDFEDMRVLELQRDKALGADREHEVIWSADKARREMRDRQCRERLKSLQSGGSLEVEEEEVGDDDVEGDVDSVAVQDEISYL